MSCLSGLLRHRLLLVLRVQVGPHHQICERSQGQSRSSQTLKTLRKLFVSAARTYSGSPPPSRLRPVSSSHGSSNPRLKAMIPSPLPFVCMVCVHCSHCHPSSCFIPPVPLCLHGHPGVQGLRWKESLQVCRLPAKVSHYFSEAVSKDLLQHVLALPRLPARWKMGPDARP